MKTSFEIKNEKSTALRLFVSSANARKNNVRIHHHSQIEISFILRGQGIYRTKDKTYEINEGDFFFFRPNELHCITDIEENGMELLNLHVEPSYIYTNFQNVLTADFIKILTTNFKLESNKINDFVASEQIREIERLFFSIQNEFLQSDSDYISMIRNNISNILILISRSCDKKQLSEIKTENYQKIISTIRYIDENFKNDISLDAIAKKVAYSRCYLSTVFKKCMGMSLWDYISIKRIEEASTLIKTTDKNILDIALTCGFNNAANFNKLFKKYTNVSPLYFRKSHG